LRERADLAGFGEHRAHARVGSEETVRFGWAQGELEQGSRGLQIIVIPSRLAKARTLNVSLRHLLASLFGALVLLVCMTAGLYWVTFRFAADIKVPLVQELVLTAQQGEAERARKFVQQNLNAMAVKLGEMQAQLARLDALGDRLSALAGIRPQECLPAGTVWKP
jgi:hypothetical protein